MQHLSNHFKEEHAFYLHSQLIHTGSCKHCNQAIQKAMLRKLSTCKRNFFVIVIQGIKKSLDVRDDVLTRTIHMMW